MELEDFRASAPTLAAAQAAKPASPVPSPSDLALFRRVLRESAHVLERSYADAQAPAGPWGLLGEPLQGASRPVALVPVAGVADGPAGELVDVWADGVYLLEGRDYVLQERHGHMRACVYLDRVPDGARLLAERRRNVVRPEWVVQRAASARGAGELVLRHERAPRSPQPAPGQSARSWSYSAEALALYRRDGASSPWRLAERGVEWEAELGSVSHAEVTVLTEVAEGEEFCVMDLNSFYRVIFEVPQYTGLAQPPVARLDLEHVAGPPGNRTRLPIPAGRAADLRVRLETDQLPGPLLLEPGTHYLVSLDDPLTDPAMYVLLSDSLPGGSRVIVECPGALSPSMGTIGEGTSEPHAVAALLPALSPLVEEALSAHAKGYRVMPDELVVLNDAALRLAGAAAPHGLSVESRPRHTQLIEPFISWYLANKTTDTEEVEDLGFSAWLASWLAANPGTPTVADDGRPEVELGQGERDRQNLSLYIRYGPGGIQPEEPRAFDANELDSVIVAEDFSLDANDLTLLVDQPYPARTVDANVFPWPFETPRPVPTDPVAVVYGAAQYDYSDLPTLLEV